jgi:hypothetical protein
MGHLQKAFSATMIACGVAARHHAELPDRALRKRPMLSRAPVSPVFCSPPSGIAHFASPFGRTQPGHGNETQGTIRLWHFYRRNCDNIRRAEKP